MRSSAYGCRLTETHLARRLRLLGSPPDLVRSGPVVQGPHPYAEPRSKALSDLVCSTAQLGAYRYFIIFRFGFQGAFVFPLFYIYTPPGCGALLLLRGAAPACKKQTAAPAPPRLFLPQAAARLSCPPSGGAGLFHLHHPEGAVCGLEPLSRGGPAGPGLPLWAGGWV